jgi:ABC-2 type transport system ATP-binding protein
MDEAERCHRLAYIAWGSLLAVGTGAEIVARQGLAAWCVTGADLSELARQLIDEPSVDNVTPFGNELHVTGHDVEALAATAQRFAAKTGQSWTQIAANLEDVFIALMGDGK